MKKFFACIFAAVFASAALFAQTPEEIITRMDLAMDAFDDQGCAMVMDIKIPILGTISTQMYVLGDKSKAIAEVKDNKLITWIDGTTQWTYESDKNEITISNTDPSNESDAESNMKLLDGVTDGYDVKLKKEDAAAWYFHCTKQKTNPRKDDPKNMDLVVSKATYLPISVKVSEKGVAVTLRDFAIGVNEKDITFNAADFPTAKIVDERK
jgi:outer membrane lipoprotein-sorting protein